MPDASSNIALAARPSMDGTDPFPVESTCFHAVTNGTKGKLMKTIPGEL
jgi:hypothetical protein